MKKKSIPVLLPKYSGKYSHGFWKKIGSLAEDDELGPAWNAAYVMGVMLQNLESHVLRFINEELKKAAARKPQKSPTAKELNRCLNALVEAHDNYKKVLRRNKSKK